MTSPANTGAATPTAPSSSSPTPGAATTAPAVSSTLTPPKAKGVVWKPQGSTVNGVPVTYVARVEGGSVSLLWMDSSVLKFRYVPGYVVPEGGPTTAADHKPKTWLPLAAAGFNGGFQLADGRGGYYYDNQTVRSLEPGLGAFVITEDGTLKVGKWGRDLHKTNDTLVVRQNLPLIVDNSQDESASGDWGVADGGAAAANRSALGQLPGGGLVFAFGADVTPGTMANALTKVGVKNAMVLDMNKSWPTGFTYSHTKGKLRGEKIHPSIWRNPEEYYAQFQKDFVMAQLPPSAG